MKRTGFYIPFWCMVHRNYIVETTIARSKQIQFLSILVSLIPLNSASFSFFFLVFLVLAAFFVMCAPLLLCNNSSSQKVRKLHVICGLVAYEIQIQYRIRMYLYKYMLCTD